MSAECYLLPPTLELRFRYMFRAPRVCNSVGLTVSVSAWGVVPLAGLTCKKVGCAVAAAAVAVKLKAGRRAGDLHVLSSGSRRANLIREVGPVAGAWINGNVLTRASPAQR